MAAGDFLRRFTQQDQLLFDAQGNLVGIKNPNANGADLRSGASYTWAGRPASGNLSDRIRITDLGFAGANVVWDGTAWIPDGAQLLGRGSAANNNLTGTVTETAMATVTIPAGAMGLNGGLQIRSVWTVTNSANNKSLRARLGGMAGTQFLAAGVTTVVVASDQRTIRNRNSAASQITSYTSTSTTSLGNSSNSATTGTVDTSAAQDLVFTGQLTNTGETITLESYEVWLLP